MGPYSSRQRRESAHSSRSSSSRQNKQTVPTSKQTNISSPVCFSHCTVQADIGKWSLITNEMTAFICFHLHWKKKEIRCSWDSEILHEIVRDTTRKLKKNELIRGVSRTISCSISEPRFTSFPFLQGTLFACKNLKNLLRVAFFIFDRWHVKDYRT